MNHHLLFIPPCQEPGRSRRGLKDRALKGYNQYVSAKLFPIGANRKDSFAMLISDENLKIRNAIFDFDRRIELMHLDFQKYSQGLEARMPDWEKLERDLIVFSRRKLIDLELSKNLERVLYKFQTRKRIWLKWAEEFHKRPQE
jgi:hypothetical protein